MGVQGPEASNILQGLTAFDLRSLTFGKCAFVPIEGYNVHVARGGYTGEDGFEISIPPKETEEFTSILLRPPVQLTGLGARDSLRLEAGMCLYGHDLDEYTSPIEAGLTWVIGRLIVLSSVLRDLISSKARIEGNRLISLVPLRCWST